MSTLKQLRERVQSDLDLEDEIFITDSDINDWINEAVRKAEATIHTLYEDYFLSSKDVAVLAGSYEVDYPDDLYANKVRKIIFNDGTAQHEVKRVKNLVTASYRDINESTVGQLEWTPYNGLLADGVTTGRKIRLFPKAGKSGTLTIWYLRNALRLASDTDSCDIDEYERYIIQSVKTECYFKDGDPRGPASKQLEDELKQDMINTLSNMVPDNNDEIPMDLSFYGDCVDEVGE